MFNPMIMGMGMGAGMPVTSAGMPVTGAGMLVTASPRKERSSSPVYIPGDVHAFCEAYGIKEEEEQALESLGFVIGDDLNQVTEREYKEAGFKPLAWKRVLKAYKQYKHAAKD